MGRSKTIAFLMFIILFFGLFGLPMASKRAALPNSVEPSAVAKWLSSSIQYWLDIFKGVMKQLKI